MSLEPHPSLNETPPAHEVSDGVDIVIIRGRLIADALIKLFPHRLTDGVGKRRGNVLEMQWTSNDREEPILVTIKEKVCTITGFKGSGADALKQHLNDLLKNT